MASKIKIKLYSIYYIIQQINNLHQIQVNTWIFCIANALGDISRAAIAANSRPVSPLTTTRLNKQAQATAVK